MLAATSLLELLLFGVIITGKKSQIQGIAYHISHFLRRTPEDLGSIFSSIKIVANCADSTTSNILTDGEHICRLRAATLLRPIVIQKVLGEWDGYLFLPSRLLEPNLFSTCTSSCQETATSSSLPPPRKNKQTKNMQLPQVARVCVCVCVCLSVTDLSGQVGQVTIDDPDGGFGH